MRVFAVMAALSLSAAPASVPLKSSDAVLAGQVSVIDGDTLALHGRKIRLYGVDAPESGQACGLPSGGSWRCGQKAALALSDHIGRATVRCKPKTTDRYGRTVAICHARGRSLNAWLVRHGWALAYRQYGGGVYGRDESEARRHGRGVWQGPFDKPWDWRKGKRTRPLASNAGDMAG
jgi:endonuclease YncB( thermonuclease family)